MAARPQQLGVFGGAEPARINRQAMAQPKAAGYAAPPGSGPEGETCGTCLSCRFKVIRGRRVYKCGRMTRSWTHGRESDVSVRSPACELHEKGAPSQTGIV